MKSLFTKVMSLFLVFLMLLPVFASCKKEGAAPEDVSEEASEEVPEETSAPKTKNENAVAGSTTLMVYMVGSDLESKSGAGTNDLEEIAQSGADAENVSVIVYATGTTNWHNDAAVSKKRMRSRIKGRRCSQRRVYAFVVYRSG